MISRQDIHDFLHSNGIDHTDTVLVHTSFRSIGGVEGGCDAFIDAFCSYLREGLFLVPTHTWANVTEKSPVYDVHRTPPCIGALPTAAAFRPDGVRSLHPTHSMVAFGTRAREYVRGEECSHSPCPAGGAWARLYDEGATVLLIGVGLNRNTYIHAIDERLDLPFRLADPVTLYVVDGDGSRHALLFSKHAENTGSENFGVFEGPLEELGALRYAMLGNARVGIFDVRAGTDAIVRMWSRAEYDLTREPRGIPREYYM